MPQKHSTIKPKVFQGDLDEETYELYLKDNRLAVDCEMMGLNPRRDRLCVVQTCDSSNHFSIIQILQGQNSAPRLQQLLENPDIGKVFHFARMDMLFLNTHLGIKVNPIFCTKIASKLCRTYTDKHGLKDIIREFYGENLDKKNQSSDWGKKILTKDQLEYAAEDVRFLVSLEQILTEMLIREKRFELAEQCFQFVSTLIQLDFLEMKDTLEH
jgi:ribonuclease D